jgi:hypothetical protein
LAARWRPKAKMTSLFDSSTPILYRLFVEIFRLSLTVQKLIVCIYLAGNLASRLRNLGVLGDDHNEVARKTAVGEKHCVVE